MVFERLQCSSFPLIESYCSKIPKNKNISFVRHGLSLLRPYAQYLTSTTGIEKLWKDEARLLVQNNAARMRASVGRKSRHAK